MKKLSILSLHLGYGGIERCIASLANMLADTYEVEITCSYKLYEKPAFPIDSNVKIIYLMDEVPNRREIKEALTKKNLIKIFKEGIKSTKILRKRKNTMIDYIKNTDSDIIISTRDIFNTLLGEYGKNNVKKIGWEHNHHHNNLKYVEKITKSVSKLDYLVLVSQSLKDYYQEELKYHTCKCIYIPNVIEEIPKKSAKLTNKRIVSVGRLSKEKGFLDLLKVFEKVIEKDPEMKLDIIGDGPCKQELEEYMNQNEVLKKNVILHGFQNKEYISSILLDSSIYVMTSYTESFGIVLIEAMSHGVPCIAFDSAEGAKELITNEENGYLISNRNIEEMANKILELMNNKKLRKELGKNGKEYSKKFTSQNVSKEWENLLEKEE